MRYARNVNGTYFDYIDIPQPWPANYWTNDPVVFCQKMFPGTTGWAQVSDTAGAVAAPAVPTAYKEVRKWEFATFASTAVGGAATFGGIIKACRDSIDNAVIGSYELFKSQSTLTYNEAAALLTLLVTKLVVTAQQKTDILAAWPVVPIA